MITFELETEVPVRIAWSTRNWLLSISIILISAGILHPTIHSKWNKILKLTYQVLLNYGTKYIDSEYCSQTVDLTNSPLTSTISPGTRSVAGSMEKQPATYISHVWWEWFKITFIESRLSSFSISVQTLTGVVEQQCICSIILKRYKLI